MLQYRDRQIRCDDQGGPQPTPGWKEPKPPEKPATPEPAADDLGSQDQQTT